MDWKQADKFLDEFHGVPNYSSLSEKDKKELTDLLRKEWDVQAWEVDTDEDESKKKRLLQNITDYKSQKWGSL